MRSTWSILLAAVTTLVAGQAHAQGATVSGESAGADRPPPLPDQSRAAADESQPNPARRAANPSDENEEVEPEPVVPASDTLSGHLLAAANVGWAVPFGRLDSAVTQAQVMSTGLAPSVDVSYGLSRVVAVGVRGQMLFSWSTDRCPDCTTQSYALGPLVRYHLAQGTRFDPWLGAGAGIRVTSVRAEGNLFRYAGPEWLFLLVGGDWYFTRSFGLGPLLELDAGVHTDRPSLALLPGVDQNRRSRTSAWHWLFVGGIRLVLDTPGK